MMVKFGFCILFVKRVSSLLLRLSWNTVLCVRLYEYRYPLLSVTLSVKLLVFVICLIVELFGVM